MIDIFVFHVKQTKASVTDNGAVLGAVFCFARILSDCAVDFTYHVSRETNKKATKSGFSHTFSGSFAVLGINIVNSVYSSPSTLLLFMLIPWLFMESIAFVMVE